MHLQVLILRGDVNAVLAMLSYSLSHKLSDDHQQLQVVENDSYLFNVWTKHL